MHSSDVIVCPTCQTVIDPDARCPSERAALRCMEKAGHEGWHWTETGSKNGLLIWTGVYVTHSCPGRLDLTRWCKRPYGHDGTHNDGRGVSFGDPEPCCSVCGNDHPSGNCLPVNQ